MSTADLSPPAPAVLDLAALQAENTKLRERLESAEHYTAHTLARATRLGRVISVLGHDTDFDHLVDRAAIEMAELFSADIALLMVGPPLGLSGDDIPLEARIIHVADAYVAMTSDRPYRSAMTSEEALHELQRHRGTEFDAEIVDALLEQARAAQTAA